ncbi:MAG TPA: PAS domain S-box protein [Gemmatimonadaceae bacterium]|nr:PAS domain S-box protein [Gemmatimonadaceae bacterium]
MSEIAFSDEVLSNVFEYAGIGMAITSLDKRFLRVNDGLSELLGWPVDALIGQSVHDVSHPDDLPEDVQLRDQLLAGTIRRYTREKRYRHASGRYIWVQVHVAIVRDTMGQPSYFVGQIHDISARKRAEALLQESEERYRTLIENIPIGLYRMTPDGHFLDVNAALMQMLGYTDRAELLATDTHAFFVDPDDRERFVKAMMDNDPAPASIVVQKRRRDGGQIWSRMTARIVRGDDGQLLYYEGATEDITALRQNEEQLRQSQKMEAMGRLAGGIAHDFNNLLTAIKGNAAMVLDSLPQGSPDALCLQELDAAATRAAGLTRQLLAFSRRQVLQTQVLDLNAIIAESRPLLGRLIREDIEVIVTPDASATYVRGDRSQIDQVLLNLAVNARDAMPHGGVLSLRTMNVLFDSSRSAITGLAQGRYVLLSVSDNGCGMDAETRARIFEPFFTTKERGKGTGLGLAIVYGIVRQSGGAIEVDTAPGAGATFNIYLPVCETCAAEAQMPPAGRPKPANGKSVLVVEDEEAVRRYAARVLANEGYTVVEAGDGVEALDRWQTQGGVDVVLTDVIMPRMGGRILVERLRAMRPDLPVVFMSGYAEDSMPSVLFLEKPFGADAMARVVATALRAPSSATGTKPQ